MTSCCTRSRIPSHQWCQTNSKTPPAGNISASIGNILATRTLYTESPNTVPVFGWAQPQHDGSTERICYFNKYMMNPSPVDPPSSAASCAPIGWRHHARSTANHELGHAIFLDHNSADDWPLMYDYIHRYFIWKTEIARAEDLVNFELGYPVCP